MRARLTYLALALAALCALPACDTAYANTSAATTSAATSAASDTTRAPAITTLSGILGSLLKVDFDLANGVSVISGAVDTLTDQKSGIVIAAAASGNRPTYTAFDANFSSKPSMTTAVTGNKCVRSNADEGAVILASGTLPYVAWVGKLGAQSASTNDFAWSLGSTANANRFAAIWFNGGTFQVEKDNAGIAATGITPDTNPHFYEFGWSDSTTVFVAIDGVQQSTATSSTITGDALRASIGCRHAGDRPTNGTWVRWWASTSTPSASQRSAEHSFATANYGTP